MMRKARQWSMAIAMVPTVKCYLNCRTLQKLALLAFGLRNCILVYAASLTVRGFARAYRRFAGCLSKRRLLHAPLMKMTGVCRELLLLSNLSKIRYLVVTCFGSISISVG